MVKIKSSDEENYKLVRPYEIDHLYKYRSFSSRGLKEIFQKQQVYLSSPLDFNDPFDCCPRAIVHPSKFRKEKYIKEILKLRNPNVTKHQVKKVMNSKNGRWLLSPEGLKESFQEITGSFGIYSLSEVQDDILMWTHYSDSHKGICLEFDTTKIGTLFWESFIVVYQKEYPTVNTMDLGKIKEFCKALATKSEHWKYEQERRILRGGDEGGPGIYSFNSELLTGVILGSKISEQNELKILKWVKEYPTPITIYRAKLNDHKFAINIEIDQKN